MGADHPGSSSYFQLHRSHELFPWDSVRTGGIGKAGRSQPVADFMADLYSHIKPSLATIILFSLINHWNSWFDGLIYSNHTTNYPLQSYLQTLVTSTTEILAQGDVKAIAKLVDINDTNMKAAQIFISVIPLMLIYPFLQKYFTTGLTMGSVKG